jgi:phosphomannomutase
MMKTRYFFSPPEKIDEIFKRIRIMNKGTYPEIIGNQFKIKSVRDMTTGFDSSKEDFKTVLPVTPESQMITFTFEDDSTCTLRNSGTEPKGSVEFFLILVKYYVEVNDKDKSKAEKKLVELTKWVIEDLLQPKENELIAPSDD